MKCGDIVYYQNPYDGITDQGIIQRILTNDGGDLVAEVKGNNFHVITRFKNLKKQI